MVTNSPPKLTTIKTEPLIMLTLTAQMEPLAKTHRHIPTGIIRFM